MNIKDPLFYIALLRTPLQCLLPHSLLLPVPLHCLFPHSLLLPAPLHCLLPHSLLLPASLHCIFPHSLLPALSIASSLILFFSQPLSNVILGQFASDYP